MNTRKLENAIWLAMKLGWIIFVAVVAIRVAIDGYVKNGIGGFFLGLVMGIFGGALSATVWFFIFCFILKIGRSVFQPRKRSVESP